MYVYLTRHSLLLFEMGEGQAGKRAMEVAEAVCRPDFYLSSQVVHLQRVINEGPMKYPSDIPPNTHVVSLPEFYGNEVSAAS